MPRKIHTVACQVIRSYNLHIVAESEEEALKQVRAMTVAEITYMGAEDNVTTDYFEII